MNKCRKTTQYSALNPLRYRNHHIILNISAHKPNTFIKGRHWIKTHYKTK